MGTNKDATDSSHVEAALDLEQVPSAAEPAKPSLTESGKKQARDKAAEFLSQAGHRIVVTPADDKRILRKIDLNLLPVILFVYCLQSLDKTTLSYASVFGLSDDAHLQKNQLSWLGSIVYIAQLVFQPLVAYSLVRFPIGKFITTMVLCWGATLCFMAAATNFAELMVTRLLLGAFEASVGKFFLAAATTHPLF